MLGLSFSIFPWATEPTDIDISRTPQIRLVRVGPARTNCKMFVKKYLGSANKMLIAVWILIVLVALPTLSESMIFSLDGKAYVVYQRERGLCQIIRVRDPKPCGSFLGSASTLTCTISKKRKSAKGNKLMPTQRWLGALWKPCNHRQLTECKEWPVARNFFSMVAYTWDYFTRTASKKLAHEHELSAWK